MADGHAAHVLAHPGTRQLRHVRAGQEDACTSRQYRVPILRRRDQPGAVRHRAAERPAARSTHTGGAVYAARDDSHRPHLPDRVCRQRRRSLRRQRAIQVPDQAVPRARGRVDDDQRGRSRAVCVGALQRPNHQARDSQVDAGAVHPDPIAAPVRRRGRRARRHGGAAVGLPTAWDGACSHTALRARLLQEAMAGGAELPDLASSAVRRA